MVRRILQTSNVETDEKKIRVCVKRRRLYGRGDAKYS